MTQQNVPPEWQEVKRIYERLNKLGFSAQLESFGVYSAQDRIFTASMFPRHQVEWLRSYADIFYVAPLSENTYIVNAPDLKEYLCVVAFRMKDTEVSLPLPDADAILPPKPES